MKGRRKSKKGRAKRPRVAGANDVADDVSIQNALDNSGLDELDNDESESEKETESPSPLAADPPKIPTAVNSGGTSGETAGQLVYRRVKVKIKTSKTLEPQPISSNVPTQSGMDKIGQPTVVNKQEALNEKTEDSANSLPETNTGTSVNISRSPGNIYIKRFNSASVSPRSKTEPDKGQTADLKPESLCKDPQLRKQELDSSLEVIRKVMKMDAAEPFNTPVDPIALGIPDYFDVIDTPMDFGTICSNLESGSKYMNSEDVYKDVQYIWNNCYKYNNKGDYIMDLMKRVKKNFTKYWAAAGLFYDPEGSTSADAIQTKDVTPCALGKTPVKADPVTPPTKKTHGLRKHKDGCLCAICVMIRRRQEREVSIRMLGDHEASDDYDDEGSKAEEISATESPVGECTSMDIDNSMEQDGDHELKGRGVEMRQGDAGLHHQPPEKPINEKDNEITNEEKEGGEMCEQAQSVQGSQKEENKLNHRPPKNLADDNVSNKSHAEGTPSPQENDVAKVERHKTKETIDKRERAKMYERLRYLENSKLFELCGTLFNEKSSSVWSGPHSLIRKEDATHNSKFLSAVTSFMR